MSDVIIRKRWHTVAEVAEFLGQSESMVMVHIIQGDQKSESRGA